MRIPARRRAIAFVTACAAVAQTAPAADHFDGARLILKGNVPWTSPEEAASAKKYR
jgi:hypothetical protein